MQAVILAAGKGERMRPLTETLPKVMLPIAGKPLLQHMIEGLKGLVEEVILIVGYKKEIVRNHFSDEFLGMKMTYITQEKQLGTGHAIFMVKDIIKDRFMVLMGDHVHTRKDFEKCLKNNYSILVQKVGDPSNFGVCVTEGKKVVNIVEKPKKFVSDLANAAVYVLDRKIFNYKMTKSERGEYEITEALLKFCKDEELNFVETDEWYQMTYPWDLLEVNESMIKKSGGHIDPTAKISRDAKIDKNVIIGKNAEVKNAVIRPYTVIGDDAVIGNFVEIKNVIVMEGTKIPHLSYIGDSIIGRNCNFGAGTKVANLRFDDRTVKIEVKGKKVDTGRRKLGCIMGDDVKTGINASIMPGAMIKPGTFLDAGKVHS